MTVRLFETRADAVERSPGGALRLSATPTRTGVFEYQRADGSSVSELRHPDDVFAPESLASLEDVAVTLGHARSNVMTPDQFQRLSVGHVRAGSVRADGGAVRASVVIARGDAIDGVNAGKLGDLSGGYGCTIVPESGTYEGRAYSQRQTQIRYTHLSLEPVGKGRLGSQCALRLDAAGEQITDEPAEQVVPGDQMKITIAGKEYTSEAEAQAAVAALEARADAATARADSAEAKVAEGARAALLAQAKPFLPEGFDAKDKSAREIQVACVTRGDAKFSAEGKSDAYVQARYDVLVEAPAKPARPADPITRAFTAPESPRGDSTPAAETDPRAYAAHMTNKGANAWRNSDAN